MARAGLRKRRPRRTPPRRTPRRRTKRTTTSLPRIGGRTRARSSRFTVTSGRARSSFTTSRSDARTASIWPQPTDNAYTTTSPSARQRHRPWARQLCTPSETGNGTHDNPASTIFRWSVATTRRKPARTCASGSIRSCTSPTTCGSSRRSTSSTTSCSARHPRAIRISLPAGGGYQVAQPNGYNYNSVNSKTIVPPTSGVNSLQNSIAVKRVWAEYTTPVGELRFGRMPDNFGLGMVHNSGDGYDDDYQSTIDRLQFITAIKPLDLYIGGSWDFPGEGYIVPAAIPGGQPYDSAQLDDANQWSLIVMRKQSPELTKTALAHDQLVVNGGAYVTLRKQLLADDQNGARRDSRGRSSGCERPERDAGRTSPAAAVTRDATRTSTRPICGSSFATRSSASRRKGLPSLVPRTARATRPGSVTPPPSRTALGRSANTASRPSSSRT